MRKKTFIESLNSFEFSKFIDAVKDIVIFGLIIDNLGLIFKEMELFLLNSSADGSEWIKSEVA